MVNRTPSVLSLLRSTFVRTPTSPADVAGVVVADNGADWSIDPSRLADLDLASCKALFGQGYYPCHVGTPDADAMPSSQERALTSAPTQRQGTVRIRLRTLI